ncbi:hypothetical protein ISS86_03375 [Candidatus Microgenomates bacterium]|nr:hypothetical protein [Candidatus Microgenomates bacterium]
MNPVPIRASTQEHLPIEDIRDDIIILKDGSCCLVLQVSAINFDLLSEKEQKAMIFAYAALLNSLSFSIQILIRSKRKDISAYLKLLTKQEKNLKKLSLKKQLTKYKQFIEETVKKNEVLDKKFYVVIPFSTLELGTVQTAVSIIKKKKTLPYPKEYIVQRAKTNLAPKKDHLVKQFNRLGIKSYQLKTKELVNLFFSIYNPGKKQELAEIKEITTPILGGKI